GLVGVFVDHLAVFGHVRVVAGRHDEEGAEDEGDATLEQGRNGHRGDVSVGRLLLSGPQVGQRQAQIPAEAQRVVGEVKMGVHNEHGNSSFPLPGKPRGDILKVQRFQAVDKGASVWLCHPTGSTRTIMFETDEELLQACRRGDARAWRGILDRYERLLYSIPLNYGLTAEDAADVVQLTLTIFLQKLDELDDASNLAAWLATVARRHSWRRLAQRRREQLGLGADAAEGIASMSDGENQGEFVRWELLEWLNQGLNDLD